MINNNQLNPAKIHSFFKSYDVRGTTPAITKELFYWIGYGIITQVFLPENKPTTINLCHDTRLTSPEFFKAFYNGVKDAGGDVIALGISSSDFLYAACQVNGLPGAIITASHNPKDDNGVKIVKEGSTMLGLSEGLDKVRDFVIENINKEIDTTNWTDPEIDKIEKVKIWDYFENKIKEIGKIEKVNNILKSRNQTLKIAVDSGNAMGGWVMEKIKNLYSNIHFVPLFWELDGNYPNHEANPQDFKNLQDLQKTVLENSDISFGFAFDGDADRVFFIDEKAKVVQGDFLVSLFASSLLKEYYLNPDPNYNSAIVYIQPGSRCVLETIAENDGIAIPAKQGHTHIKAAMQKFKAIYGGEFSGHHYFADFSFMDSGILAAVLMIKIIVESNKSIQETFAKLDKSYFISDLVSFKIPENKTFEDLKKTCYKNFSDATFSQYDGISVFYPDWKFSIRPSGTEPVVRLILETRGKDLRQEKIKLIEKYLFEK
jgi:phosphomannomutase